MYNLIRTILFFYDAEKAHHIAMKALVMSSKTKWLAEVIKKMYAPNAANQSLQLWNLNFKNRVGLAAGFDKNAEYVYALSLLGFGFIEVGTVTPLPQEGNPLPRLFRLKADEALINRMGFNNKGVAAMKNNLKQLRK